MKKIAYIELDTHAEIAGNFMELIESSDKFTVEFYFSEKILKALNLKQSEHVILSNSKTLIKQIQSKNYDLVIIGTVHRYFNVFEKITKLFNTSIIVHNQNFTTLSKFQLIKNIFKEDTSFRLKLLLKEGLLSSSKVYNQAKNLLVLDESLAHQKFQFLPVFYNKFNETEVQEIFTIVVPGAVSQHRRNYLHILRKLKEFEKPSHKNNLLQKLQIVFLGKAKNEELSWLKNFENEKLDNVQIKYFEEKVPQDVFDDWMKKADVLWCPIQTKTKFFSNEEIYGTTKMSGNIGDTIKYGKIAVFPQEENKPFLLKENINIFEQFSSLQSENKYSFETEFNQEKIREKLEQNLLRLF